MAVGDDLGQQCLDRFQAGDRMMELHPMLGVLGGMRDRRLGDADGLCGLGHGADRKNLAGDAGSAVFGAHDATFGHRDVLEVEMSDRASPQAHGFQPGSNGQAAGPGIDDETSQSGVIGIRPDDGEHQINIRRTGVAYEHLASVKHETASLTRGEQRVRTGSQGRTFLLDGDRAELFTFDQGGQILLLLCLAAPMCDGIFEQGVVVDDGGDARTGSRQGLNDFYMGNEAGAGYTRLFRRHEAEEIMCRQLRDQRFGEHFPVIEFAGDRIKKLGGENMRALLEFLWSSVSW